MSAVSFLVSLLSIDFKRIIKKYNLNKCISSESVESLFKQQYVPWSSAKDYLKNDDYCSYIDLLTAFENIQKINLHSNENRKKALEILNNIKIEKLVARKKRFPVNGYYVNLTNSVYAELYNEIIDALNCKNNCTSSERQIISCNCKDIFSNRLTWLYNLHYKYSINELYFYGVYNRKNFEMWHALSWF